MKKKILILSAAIVVVAAVGLGAFGIASAAGLNLPALQTGSPYAYAGRILGHGGDGPLRPYIEEATADILGITVDELQALLEDGATLTDLIEAAGLTVVEFRSQLEAALPEIVEQALADEAITQEQADAILANGLPVRGFWSGALQPYILEASAEILGMSADELQAALDAGTTVSELLEEAGMTHLQFRMALDEATPGIVETALADEAITQEQADQILEYGLQVGRCGGGHHGRGGGPGGFGPGGPDGSGFGPGFPGGSLLSENG